jgi:hypothetical protein
VPTIYSIDGKNSGKDVSITIKDNLGNQVNAAQIGILTHFSVETDYQMWETKSLINGGAVFFESLPHGSKCKMKFARYNSALEDMESSYRTNSLNGTQVSYTIQYQTVNRDGSINTRQLLNCKPHNWNLGEYAPDADVTQSVDFVSTDVSDTGSGSGLFGS